MVLQKRPSEIGKVNNELKIPFDTNLISNILKVYLILHYSYDHF